jgi:hypothetical protein
MMRQPGAAVTIPYLIAWDTVENTQRRELTEIVDRWHKRYPAVSIMLLLSGGGVLELGEPHRRR